MKEMMGLHNFMMYKNIKIFFYLCLVALFCNLFFYHKVLAQDKVEAPTSDQNLTTTTPDLSPNSDADKKPVTATTATSSEKKLDTEEISIPVGIDKVIELDFSLSAQMNLGDSSLLRVEPDLRRNKITLIGLKAGNTSLTLRDAVGDEKKRYLISVTSDDLSKTVAELRDLIGDVEGIEIGIRGGRVYVGGQIVVPNDIKRVAAVLESFGNTSILRLIEMSPQTQLLIAQEMQDELLRNNFKNLTVRVINKAFWVEGTLGSQEEANVVREITKAFLPEKIEAVSSASVSATYPEGRSAIVYFLSIDQKTQDEQNKQPIPKQVKISSQFVELKKDYSKIFGFKWAPLMSDDDSKIQIGEKQNGDVSTSSSGAFSAIISNLFPRLNSMKNAGYGRIINSGMAITKDKVQATVDRTTEIPFLTGGSGDYNRPAVANSGVTLTVTPTILEEENINLKVSFSVRMANPVGGGALSSTNNKVDTELIVKSGETAAIGGIMQSQDLTNYDRDDPAPVSSSGTQSPPRQLFGIMRSRSQNVSRNQYVVFITPEIIASASEGTTEIKNKFKKRGR